MYHHTHTRTHIHISTYVSSHTHKCITSAGIFRPFKTAQASLCSATPTCTHTRPCKGTERMLSVQSHSSQHSTLHSTLQRYRKGASCRISHSSQQFSLFCCCLATKYLAVALATPPPCAAAAWRRKRHFQNVRFREASLDESLCLFKLFNVEENPFNLPVGVFL